MPCRKRFIAARRAVFLTSSVPQMPPLLRCLRCSGVRRLPYSLRMYSAAASRKPPVPLAGSVIVSSGVGRTQSMMAWISGRGVKY